MLVVLFGASLSGFHPFVASQIHGHVLFGNHVLGFNVQWAPRKLIKNPNTTKYIGLNIQTNNPIIYYRLKSILIEFIERVLETDQMFKL